MYIVPDLLELQFPHVIQGYFSRKVHSREDKLKILCNWICIELIANKRSWSSIREELKLEENNPLESYFHSTMGLSPQDFADYWIRRL